MEKLLKKVIAMLLIMTMTSANLILLGNYTIVYALSDETSITKQTAKTQNSNVEFDVYLDEGKHTLNLDVETKDAKLYVNIKVKNSGYLKNGIITLQNVNFKISDKIDNIYIQSIDAEKNRIILKQLNKGSDVTLELPIEILSEEKVPLDILGKESKTIFTGNYIDASGKEKEISKEVINKIYWNSNNLEAQIDAEVTKYIPLKKGEQYKVLVQAKVKSGIKDNKLPIKNTKLEINLPEYNGLKPSSVSVIANNTLATNGEESGVNFETGNYVYDENTNTVTINVNNNPDEQQKISWTKNSIDEYLVTFVFDGKEIYDYSVENGINTTLQVLSKITAYNNSEIEALKELEITLIEPLGNIIDYNIDAQNEIAKGYIYTNYISNTKIETNYLVKYRTVVNSEILIDELKIEQEYDSLQTEQGEEIYTTVSDKNYTYNKTIKVAEKEFTKILGLDGNIDIIDENEIKLGTINKETNKDEDGNYVLDIASLDNNKLIIKTSKPVSVGIIDFTVEKGVKGDIGYSQKQMKSFVKMKTSINGKSQEILLKEPISNAEIEIDTKDLSTVVKNENVQIRAILDTSNIEYALYKNPKLKIELPQYISKVEINNASILLAGGGDGLKVENVEVKKENEAQTIYVTLQGTQTEYTIDAKYKGPMVVLDTDLEVQTFTPSKPDTIEMTYTNGNSISSNSEGKTSTDVNFVAPKDVVTANGIDSDVFVSDETKTINITPYAEKKNVSVKGKIINNYPNTISNIVVLGRLPVKDNNKIDTEEKLGSNFDTILKTEIKLMGVNDSNYKVYYSSNANATKSVLDTENNWVEGIIENAKSYLIVFNNFEIASGETIDFTYNVEIPENLKHDSSVYEMYKVYYTNNSSIGNVEETRISPIIEITTGQGPDLKVELKPTVDVVKQGQIVKMIATIKNTGDITATNVKANIELPEYSTFAECIGGQGIYDEDINKKVIQIGNLEAGKEQEISYYIRLDSKLAELPKEISNTLKVTFDELPYGISSNECILNVQEAKIAVELYSPVPEGKVLKKNDVIEYRMLITNISSNKTLENAIVTINLPEGIQYEGVVIGDEIIGVTTQGAVYDENSRNLQINLGNLNKYQYVSLNLKVGELEDSFEIMAKVTADGLDESYSNIVEYKVAKVDLEISELTSSPRYVKEAEELVYTFTITNKGTATAVDVKIVDELPEGLEFEKIQCIYGKSNLKISAVNLVDGKVEVSINALESGETAKVEIITKANLLPDKNDKEIENEVSVSAQGFEEVKTNTVTNIIEYSAEAHQTTQGGNQGEQEGQGSQGGSQEENENESGTSQIARYKITGLAWIDANQDGKRSSDEEILPNLSVVLLNKQDNSIVKDVDTGEEKRATTGVNGKYEFTNLPEGEYLVVFVYESSRYSLTTYQAKEVDTSLNSDAIDINLVLDGERKVVGMTDIIKITDENARDIDLGVYISEKFDLRLDKYISKITLTTPTIGTKTYEYTNKQAAKIEVLNKNVGQSSIVVEYKIVVTNEGAVAGYAKKIVDYLPEKLKFSTELNKDWYLSENGNVYNSSLENTKINPGESKELKLIATMKITENTLDVLNNNAEIYESYNEKGLADIDSTPANKVSEEDDISKADVVVSLVTGTVVKYITLTLGIITILGIGVYGIKSKVLIKSKKRKIKIG